MMNLKKIVSIRGNFQCLVSLNFTLEFEYTKHLSVSSLCRRRSQILIAEFKQSWVNNVVKKFITVKRNRRQCSVAERINRVRKTPT